MNCDWDFTTVLRGVFGTGAFSCGTSFITATASSKIDSGSRTTVFAGVVHVAQHIPRLTFVQRILAFTQKNRLHCACPVLDIREGHRQPAPHTDIFWIAHQWMQDPLTVAQKQRERRMFDGELNIQREDNNLLTLNHFFNGSKHCFHLDHWTQEFPNGCCCIPSALVRKRLSAHVSRPLRDLTDISRA